MTSRFVLASLALLFATVAWPGGIVGHDYVVLDPPQAQTVRGKIEVVEFFSWACPHCYDFNPALTRWKASLPPDVSFRRVPVGSGRPQWEALARAFYALESTGDLARLDTPLFDAIHKENLPLFDEASLTAWVAKHGVSTAKFAAAYTSFSTVTALGQSDMAALGYKVEFIPTLAIAGRYTVTGDHDKMITSANELIARARADRASGK